MRHVLSRRTVLVSALAAPAIARAQSDYPNRTIRLVIPWPPGASADAFLRTIADQAGKRLGQTVVPDNKPGANGSLSGVALKDAKPDGYTLGQIHTGTFRAAADGRASRPTTRRPTSPTSSSSRARCTASSCAPTARGRRWRSWSPRRRPIPAS